MRPANPKSFQHHTQYLEIQGIDEIKPMVWSEHQKLHIRLRKEGKCNISPEELGKISRKAHRRTEKGKLNRRKVQKKYNHSNKGKLTNHKFQQSEKGRTWWREYRQTPKNKEYRRGYYEELKVLETSDVISLNIVLREMWFFNEKNNDFSVWTGFRGMNGVNLKRIKENYETI